MSSFDSEAFDTDSFSTSAFDIIDAAFRSLFAFWLGGASAGAADGGDVYIPIFRRRRRY